MKISKTLLATAALVASMSGSAGAQVTGSLAGGLGSYLGLSGPATCAPVKCTLGGTVADINGGTVYGGDLPFADIPAGSVFGPKFLASGPTSGSPSTMTFNTPVYGISFLWGSPDTFNVLTINSSTSGGPTISQVFTASGLGFAKTNGDQSFSQYVTFQSNGSGTRINSLVFSNSQASDAFEAANFATVVPEPSTYALMAAGLMALGLVAKRRKQA